MPDRKLTALVELTSSADEDLVYTVDDPSGNPVERKLTRANLLADVGALTRYANINGRSGGQTLIGGTAASETLTLQSTSHATRGKILLGVNSAYDEVNTRLGIGTTSPTEALHVVEGTFAAIVRLVGNGQGQIQFDDSSPEPDEGRGALGFVQTAGQVFTNSLTEAMVFRSEAALQLGVQSTEILTIREVGYAPGNGYVGIHTTTPQSIFHIGGEQAPILSIESIDVNGKRWGLRSESDGAFTIRDTDDSRIAAYFHEDGSDNPRVGLGDIGTTPISTLEVKAVSPVLSLHDSTGSVSGGTYGSLDWVSSDGSMPASGLAVRVSAFDPLTFGDRADLKFEVNDGSTGLVESCRMDSDGSAGNTRFLLYDVDSGSLQRVKVGANNTGPGSSGRALYIDNTA